MTGILFDLDGTLLNTLDDLENGVNHTLDQLGYPRRTKEEVRRFVGNGARRLMELAIPSGEDVEIALREFQHYYGTHCQILTQPYRGIPEALTRITRRYPVAIVSNKPDGAVKSLCAQYFPGVYAIGESQGCPRKPAPDMVYKAMADLGVDRCIYVGDSEVDVLTAKNANVPCLSVLWGFRDKSEMEAVGGTNFCEKPEDLPEWIESLLQTGGNT
jgi:phosphoglycolate phosphatase